MDRIVRDRNGVGRRIWRRRRRKSGSTPPADPRAPDGKIDGKTAADAAAGDDDDDARDDDGDGGLDIDVDDAPPPPAKPEAGAKKRGLFASLRGAFAGPPKPKKAPPPDPPYLVVDPTRDVLAVPRGAARLDAFEKAIRSCPTGTPQFRALALAFHKELQALAEGAGVDLSLYETRVEACAKALIAAGEDERAGTLFLRVGRKHQAAELFVAAGAIDALEEAHAQIQWDEGGAKHEARMSFERFEALFLVGLREQAFEALERAHKLWGDNPVYSEIHASFVERLGKPKRLALSSGNKELVVVTAWPVVIGRGEEAGVRLTSPLISRAHLKLELEGGAPVVVDLESRGGTRIGGVPLAGKQPLPQGAAIDMAGVVVETRVGAAGLWLHPALAPERRTLAATQSDVVIPGPDFQDGAGLLVRFDARGRAVLEPPALLNGEPAKKPALLLEGDRIGNGSFTWTVARR